MIKEFREFIEKGNVLDFAVGVIMAGAFGAIVTSLVDDILMPIIGAATAGIDFKDIVAVVAGVELKVGVFINAIINFLIISFIMFLIVKSFNKMKTTVVKEEEEQEPATKECPYCKTEVHVDATRCPHCTSELN